MAHMSRANRLQMYKLLAELVQNGTGLLSTSHPVQWCVRSGSLGTRWCCETPASLNNSIPIAKMPMFSTPKCGFPSEGRLQYCYNLFCDSVEFMHKLSFPWLSIARQMSAEVIAGKSWSSFTVSFTWSRWRSWRPTASDGSDRGTIWDNAKAEYTFMTHDHSCITVNRLEARGISIYLAIHLSSIYPASIHLSIHHYPSIHHPFVHLSIHLPTYPSIRIPYPPIYLSVCTSCFLYFFLFFLYFSLSLCIYIFIIYTLYILYNTLYI